MEALDEEIGNTLVTQKDLATEFEYATDYIQNYSTTAERELPKVETAVDDALANVSDRLHRFKLPDLRVKVGFDVEALTLPGAAPMKMEQYASGVPVSG